MQILWKGKARTVLTKAPETPKRYNSARWSSRNLNLRNQSHTMSRLGGICKAGDHDGANQFVHRLAILK
eukprot:6249571-Amphidinium_carterae.1